jgi:hypothetical protein
VARISRRTYLLSEHYRVPESKLDKEFFQDACSCAIHAKYVKTRPLSLSHISHVSAIATGQTTVSSLTNSDNRKKELSVKQPVKIAAVSSLVFSDGVFSKEEGQSKIENICKNEVKCHDL